MIEINKKYHPVGTVQHMIEINKAYHTVVTVPTYDRNKQ
jgi:hypothetical protein